MVYILNWVFGRRNGLVILFLLILSISSLTHVRFMAQGRVISNYIQLSQKLEIRENGISVGRSLIGSRPPRCERRCSNCGHCKAVQVPIAPKLRISNLQQQTTISSKIHHFYVAYSRGDGISNYKPMCWKCQCGDSFFNP